MDIDGSALPIARLHCHLLPFAPSAEPGLPVREGTYRNPAATSTEMIYGSLPFHSLTPAAWPVANPAQAAAIPSTSIHSQPFPPFWNSSR